MSEELQASNDKKMTAGGASIWTDERVKMLRKMAATCSAGEIAAALGAGISRNAVIGKMHRDKIQGRGTIGWTEGGRERARARAKEAAERRASQRVAALANVDASIKSDRVELRRRGNVAKPARIIEFNLMEPARAPIAMEPELHCEPIGIMELTETTCRWPLEGGYCGMRTCGEGRATYCYPHWSRSVDWEARANSKLLAGKVKA